MHPSGICYDETDCREGLECGKSNCGLFPNNTNHEASCCYDPFITGYYFGTFSIAKYWAQNSRTYVDMEPLVEDAQPTVIIVLWIPRLWMQMAPSSVINLPIVDAAKLCKESTEPFRQVLAPTMCWIEGPSEGELLRTLSSNKPQTQMSK